MSTNDNGTAYGLQAGMYDADLTEVGFGTPMGTLMRRYWHPIGLAEDATDLPKAVRILGEDLILFRSQTWRCKSGMTGTRRRGIRERHVRVCAERLKSPRAR
jgi:hypothetical protein